MTQESMLPVWSAAVRYNLNPTNMVWAAGVVTVKVPDHQLTNNDVIAITSTLGSSTWVSSGVNATVVDEDTFTYPLVGDPGVLFTQRDPNSTMVICNAGVYSDSGVGDSEVITISSDTYSQTMDNPTIIQIEALPAGNTVVVQGKVHPDSSWINIQTITDADGLTQVVFSNTYDLVRVIQTVGSDQPVVYAQF